MWTDGGGGTTCERVSFGQEMLNEQLAELTALEISSCVMLVLRWK